MYLHLFRSSASKSIFSSSSWFYIKRKLHLILHLFFNKNNFFTDLSQFFNFLHFSLHHLHLLSQSSYFPFALNFIIIGNRGRNRSISCISVDSSSKKYLIRTVTIGVLLHHHFSFQQIYLLHQLLPHLQRSFLVVLHKLIYLLPYHQYLVCYVQKLSTQDRVHIVVY